VIFSSQRGPTFAILVSLVNEGGLHFIISSVSFNYSTKIAVFRSVRFIRSVCVIQIFYQIFAFGKFGQCPTVYSYSILGFPLS